MLSRRRFLGAGAMAFVPSSLRAAASRLLGLAVPAKSLSFLSLHTGESLATVYWTPDGFSAEALERINRVLRDPFTGEVKSIDVRLLDLLYDLAASIGSSGPFHVISGYRSPETNARLRREGHGVAANSLHLCGQAVDIRLPGCPLAGLRSAALALRSGGVGYYPASDFVHVDTGRVRCW